MGLGFRGWGCGSGEAGSSSCIERSLGFATSRTQGVLFCLSALYLDRPLLLLQQLVFVAWLCEVSWPPVKKYADHCMITRSCKEKERSFLQEVATTGEPKSKCQAHRSSCRKLRPVC